jgi:hypothetical protein
MKQFDDVEKKSFRECRIKRMMRGKLGGANDRLPFFIRVPQSQSAETTRSRFPFFSFFFFANERGQKVEGK